MSDYLINGSTLTNLGDAVRTVSGNNTSMTPDEMTLALNETTSVIETLNEHIADTNNPHNITASSIGAATSEDIQNVQSIANSKVFIATYGTTTFAEIKAAYDNGATVLCNRSDNQVKYILTGLTDTAAYFMGMGTSSNILYRVYVDTEWHAASFTGTPANHRSTATTYGIGTSTYYGHVKISDKTDADVGASSGIAASPAAVKAAYDLAASKAPMYGYGTEDLVAGTSELATGSLYFVYE